MNRVFDSSGPEGKVRGTPQQIIEKYQALARDAQLSNDRVAAENFLQHAEHYTRMLGEAMRELAAEQEARRQQQGGNGNNGQQDRPQHHNRREDRESQGDERAEDGSMPRREIGPVPVLPFEEEPRQDAYDSGLVETPEARAEVVASQPEPAPREPRRDDRRSNANRAPRAERKPAPAAAPAAVEAEAEAGQPAAEAPAPKPRRPRAPRRPASQGDAPETQKNEAAE